MRRASWTKPWRSRMRYAGLTNPVALAIGVASLAFIVAAGRVVPRLPAILVAVVVGTIVSAVVGIATVAGVPVVGALPPGLPRPSIPSIPIDDIQPLFAGAVAVPSSRWPTRPCCRAPRRSPRRTLQRERRVDRPRCGRSRVVSAVGLRGECERVAHLGRDVVRRSHPVGRARRCRAHRPDARVRAGAACRPALLGACCRRHRREPVAGRGRRCVRLYRMRRSEFVLSIACLAAVAVVGVVSGSSSRSGSPSSRSSGARGGPTAPRPFAGGEGAITTRAAIPKPSWYPGSFSSAGTRRSSSPMPRCSGTRSRTRSKALRRRFTGSYRGEPVTDIDDGGGRSVRARRRARGRRNRARLRRAQGPGQGPPSPLRPVRPDRRDALLPDGGRSGQRLRLRNRRAVGRLAGSRRVVTGTRLLRSGRHVRCSRRPGVRAAAGGTPGCCRTHRHHIWKIANGRKDTRIRDTPSHRAQILQGH